MQEITLNLRTNKNGFPILKIRHLYKLDNSVETKHPQLQPYSFFKTQAKNPLLKDTQDLKQLGRLIAGIDTTVRTSSIRVSCFVIQTCTFPSHLPAITDPQILFPPFSLIFLQLARIR